MPEERVICKNCYRTIVNPSKYWIHDDSRSTWCSEAGTRRAEPLDPASS